MRADSVDYKTLWKLIQRWSGTPIDDQGPYDNLDDAIRQLVAERDRLLQQLCDVRAENAALRKK